MNREAEMMKEYEKIRWKETKRKRRMKTANIKRWENKAASRKRCMWVHRSKALIGLCMLVAWLVGSVALALLTSAGQHGVELLTEP